MRMSPRLKVSADAETPVIGTSSVAGTPPVPSSPESEVATPKKHACDGVSCESHQEMVNAKKKRNQKKTMSSGSPAKTSISGVEKKKQDNDSDNESNCSLGSNASTVTGSSFEPIRRVSSGTARTLEQKEKLREEKQKEKANVMKKNSIENQFVTCM